MSDICPTCGCPEGINGHDVFHRQIDELKAKLTFKQYDEWAITTAVYPGIGHGTLYPVLGLGGETGEVLEVWKKIIRDNSSELNRESRERIKKELGDVLWYVKMCAHEIGSSLEEVAQANIDKLNLRRQKGTIHGSGSDR